MAEEEPAAAARPDRLIDEAGNSMSNMTLDVSDAPAAAPAAAEGASTSSEPAAAMMGVNLDEGGRERQQSVALNDDPLVNKVTAATSFAELQAAVKPLAEWQYAAEQAAGIERAKTYVQGSDKDVLCGFFVSSINEWKIAQPRVLVITHTAYYRVTYSHKYGRIDHYHKTPLSKLRVIEKTAVGLKIYLTEQDGNASIGKKLSGWFSKSKEKDEFEHVREYLPTVPGAFPGGGRRQRRLRRADAPHHGGAQADPRGSQGGRAPRSRARRAGGGAEGTVRRHSRRQGGARRRAARAARGREHGDEECECAARQADEARKEGRRFPGG